MDFSISKVFWAPLQVLAARAIGRLENPAHRDALIPLLHSPDLLVRRAAMGALAQMRAPFEYAALLQAERDASVRAVIYEAIGHCWDKLDNYAEARFYYRKASHLNPDDSKLYYKLACTYINEEQWSQAVKQLEAAMRIHSMQPEYNLAMGECKMQLGEFKEAIQFFSNVVRIRPRNISSWEALIRCLYNAEYFEEALDQVEAAIKITNGKPLFGFYLAAVLFALGRNREGLLQLENAMAKAPKLLKKLVELNPVILQYQPVVDIIARYKKNKSI